MKLVGHDRGTGRFQHGKSVPKARPTMFWDPQELDLSFNFNEYHARKADRESKHEKKKLIYMEKML